MAELTLGLDLGPNSIGWALLDEAAGAIVATGVRVFPEGVDRDKQGGEISKNEARRVARGMRRQIARRARRKRRLRKALVAAGLLPETALLPRDDARRVAWETEQFKIADPYVLRRRALTERLAPYELGRVLLHLAQRRGFKSNRKADRKKKNEDSAILAEISELAAAIGDKTLGEYLDSLRRDNPHARLRGRHTRREMYLQEFERIWAAQREFHPDLLTDERKDQIHREIFFQRDMYWPASVIGHCELEPRLLRCPKADNRAQRFRLLQEVNNLRLLDTGTGEERALTPEERTRLIDYLSTSKERSFDQIRKHLFDRHEGILFNLERGGRNKLKGMVSDALLAHKDLCGKFWYKRPDRERDWLVAAIADGDEKYIRRVASELGLAEPVVERLLDVDLEEGYSSYSLHAIKKLLPHLERGLPLTSRDESPCALREAGYILPWQHVVHEERYLPPPPTLTNPIVRQALHEVRKVVNAILRELVYRHGHTLARIRIELAREARGTAQQREQRTREMRDRERAREQAAEEIRNVGEKPTADKIVRYLLWQEQKRECVYTGRPISLIQLLGGEVDVDHILPYSRSLDNSLMNRVVCFRDANREKGDRTPYEWLAGSDPERYRDLLQRSDKLPYPKAKRFRQRTLELDDFFARQFVDTTYITTQVHQYVQCLGADTICVRGQHTADLRHYWGLDTVLRDDGLKLKNREDHRHHAVDAIAIALTDRSRLQQLARVRRTGDVEHGADFLPEPWVNFRADVEKAVNAIYVSHRVRRKVAGALHEETIYGPTATPGEFVYRKPLEALTPNLVESIRDKTIRQLVIQRLEAHGIRTDDSNARIPAAVWKEPLRMPSGVPIRKVRLVRRDLTIQPIREGRVCIKPGSLHHLCIFEYTDEKRQTRRDAVFVSMLDAIRRTKNHEPVIQRTHPDRPDARFIMSLSAGEMLLIEHAGTQGLYRYETAASTSRQMWFKHHCAAGRSSDKRGRISKMPDTLAARKVTVDPIGRIRWAND